MTPDAAALFAAVEATWPAATVTEIPGWLIREGRGGGKRVSAASPLTTAPDIAAMEAAQAQLGQPPLVMLRPEDSALDARLDAAGYAVVDPVTIYVAPSATVAGPIPPVRAFEVDWPPLILQRELWAEGGIGPARIDVMDRAQGPKIAVMGRANDKPAGTGYVAVHDTIAMLHALEVRPSQRRQGAAVHMMRAAAIWAQDAGIPWLSVLVTDANVPANALYNGLGMQAVGQYHYRAASSLAG